MSKRLWALVERWLTIKIGVEIRCCLSFFLMLFYYCVYRLLGGVAEAGILHLTEMVLLAYLVGWVQALLKADFDQIDRIGWKEAAVLTGGAAAYGLAAWLFGWFDGKTGVVLLFFVYMVCCGLATFWMCQLKRAIDAKLLNDELQAFQHRSADNEP